MENKNKLIIDFIKEETLKKLGVLKHCVEKGDAEMASLFLVDIECYLEVIKQMEKVNLSEVA